VAHALLDGIESLEFRFMLDNGEWSAEWPPLAQAGPSGLRMRPRAVEILLTLNDDGEISRLIEIAP
jgi:type II secretion system protein J